MLNTTITDNTPANMLRAIRAACNELLGETHTDLTTQAAEHNSRAVQLHAAAEAETDKAAAALTAHNAAPYTTEEIVKVFKVPVAPLTSHPAGLLASHEADAEREDAESVIAITEAAATAVELDSAGQPWNAELHSSSRAKIADGTWKKRRGAGKDTVDVSTIQDQSAAIINVGLGAVPPVPPAPTAEPIMPKIFALITSQIVTINQAVEAAQAEGYADLGANGLGGAPVEKQLAVLRKLEG